MMMGDAISNHVMAIDARLRAWGYETRIFAQHVAPEMAGRARPDQEFLPYLVTTDDLLIYHYSIYSPNTRLFRAFRGRRLLIYHNITPGYFFMPWDSSQATLCEIGRSSLSLLKEADFAVGDSEYNRQKLAAAGFDAGKTAVLPIFHTFDRFESLPGDEALDANLRQSGVANWLTVGRVVPNKDIEDVIRVFTLYHQAINPQSHLYIVGSRYIRKYDLALDELVDTLNMGKAITFTGRVTDAQLKIYYESADLYLTTSHHEGFCVPLVESMYFGVPILARKATAIPETLADAGVLFTHLGYEEVVEMAHLILSDDALRNQIIQKQKERLQTLSPARAEMALQSALDRLNLPHDPPKGTS